MTAMLAAITPWKDRAGAFSSLRLIVFLALLVPAGSLLFDALTGANQPEPLRGAMHDSGTDAIRILLLSLLVTPLRQMLRWPRLAELRRMVGLFALSYALLHLLLYIAYQNWGLLRALSEIALRFYLTIGIIAVLGLTVLGITSTDGWVHRMGGRRWRQLHRAVFVVAALGLLHFMLQAKSDVTEPMLTAGLFLWLAAYRAVAPEGGSPGFWQLLAISLGAALATALGEAGWYALKTGVNARLVLEANLDVSFGLRPALWVLIVGLALTLARDLARRIPRPNRRARRVRAVA
ncbi:sulfoxide reductase heme-binding subunit YedZ [Roseomonas hellenica]|uniref:Protein-methionine-sulfoxide reductase heme-binding subunit MsrQ n=2 Tax=Plastoroseomonas hellenica TaxID=2687306 RepID=A0ABS5F9J1_9PROT|nr:sulfoxide reductase heme-binding subunit YedZ [Plastoroseomonas hellenica]